MTEAPNRKHTLVIGGTRGSGRVFVREMAKENHVLSVVSRRLPAEPAPHISDVHYWVADLSDEGSVSDVWGEIIDHNGKLNSLVFFQRFRSDGDPWAGEMQTSLTATKNAIERLSGEFETDGDRSIVVVSSTASDLVTDDQPLSYHVSKAGLNQLVRYYAVGLGPKGIRVNAVSPGTVLKEEAEEFYNQNPKLHELYKRLTPLGRMGTSVDIARAIIFLCSSMASFITGQNIIVDGGLSLQWQGSLLQKLGSTADLGLTQESGASSTD